MRTEEEQPDRYIPIPRIESREAYKMMGMFAETVSDAHLQDLLDVALDGKGAFGRFKNILGSHVEEQARWFEFEAARRREIIRQWARHHAIRIDDKG